MYCLCLNAALHYDFIGSIHLFKKGKINVQEQHSFLMSMHVYMVVLFSSRYLFPAKSICPTCKQAIQIFNANPSCCSTQ